MSARRSLAALLFVAVAACAACVGGGYEVFLKYNLRGLLRIARGREWLRGFLEYCDDTPARRALARALPKPEGR